MKLYSEINKELQEEEEIISIDELREYIDKVSKKLPQKVNIVLQRILELKILSREEIIDIIEASSAALKRLCRDTYNCLYDDIVDLKRLLKDINQDIRLLPMFMSEIQRERFMKDKIDVQDILLDLDSDSGRDRCAKEYAPLVVAIAKKYNGKSSLSLNELISAGQLGLTKAMNDYHKPDSYIDVDDTIPSSDKEETKVKKGLSFKQYAGWRIRQQILNDMNDLSRVVRISQYIYQKNKDQDKSSNNFSKSLDDAEINDINISTNMKSASYDKEDEMWSKIYKFVDSKFSTRDASVFYQFFGVRGYKQKSGVEIAKSVKLTPARISYIIAKILKTIRQNNQLKQYLEYISDLYTESIISRCYNMNYQDILNTLMDDSILVILENLTRWSNPDILCNTLNMVLEDLVPDTRDTIITNIKESFNTIDESFSENREPYIEFLERIYPTIPIRKKDDSTILSYLGEIHQKFHEYELY